jgi:hypothetical protein
MISGPPTDERIGVSARRMYGRYDCRDAKADIRFLFSRARDRCEGVAMVMREEAARMRVLNHAAISRIYDLEIICKPCWAYYVQQRLHASNAPKADTEE